MTAISTTRARRWGAAGAALVSVAGAAVFGAAPAQAAAVNMNCKILSSTIPYSGTVAGALTPAKPAAGANAKLTITFPSGYKTGPVPVPAGKLQPVLYLSINGQAVTAKGGTNTSALAPNSTFTVPSTSVQFKAKSGSNTVTLTKMVFDYLPGEPDTTCTNVGAAPTIITFTTAAATTTATATPKPATSSPAPAATSAAPAATTAAPAQTAAVVPVSNGNAAQPAALPKTGPEDASRTFLLALAALEVGLIAAFRWGRPAYAGRNRGRHAGSRR